MGRGFEPGRRATKSPGRASQEEGGGAERKGDRAGGERTQHYDPAANHEATHTAETERKIQ